MQEFRYAVEQFKSQWVVSVDGTRVLSCKTKRMALEAARRATVLLQNQRADVSCRDGTAHGCGSSTIKRATAVVALPRSS